MSYSAKEYIELKSDILPYETAWGLEINLIGVTCPDCDLELAEVKFVINDYVDSCVVRAVGVCHTCKKIITAHPLKMTADGGCYCLYENTWMPLKAKWFSRFVRWLKELVK